MRSIPVTGDEGKLRQVLINLLSNAVKFTDRGEVLLSIRREGESAWFFAVSDTGPGISAEQQALVFKPFTREKTWKAGVGRAWA